MLSHPKEQEPSIPLACHLPGIKQITNIFQAFLPSHVKKEGSRLVAVLLF